VVGEACLSLPAPSKTISSVFLRSNRRSCAALCPSSTGSCFAPAAGGSSGSGSATLADSAARLCSSSLESDGKRLRPWPLRSPQQLPMVETRSLGQPPGAGALLVPLWQAAPA